MLFFKGGTNMAFKKNYYPDFKYGHLNETIGFKFSGR